MNSTLHADWQLIFSNLLMIGASLIATILAVAILATILGIIKR